MCVTQIFRGFRANWQNGGNKSTAALYVTVMGMALRDDLLSSNAVDAELHIYSSIYDLWRYTRSSYMC